MTTKIATTTALILATFALVGLTTTGAVAPPAFAQESGIGDPLTGVGGLLDDLLSEDDSNATDGTDGTETETETTTTELSGDQSETNTQSNSLDQDQTAAINEEIASGEGSDAASSVDSSAESNYKTKSKDGGSSPIPATNTADSTGTSDVSNTGAIDQDQTLDHPTQVNNNDFGNDESRAAVVGFDFDFENEQQTPEDNGATTTAIPLVIP